MKRHSPHRVIGDLMSDNDPQYVSEEFAVFAKDWN